MDDAKAQLADKLRSANNILVTVSRDPSIDQLASCIALTLLLNKQGKHAAAVFSGQVPSTLEFLQPEETLEKTTDSLRDFIISLDKTKADKLRYKVEDSVVRIFITPYKTSISEADLAFTQGDFNVDVVVALGVHLQEDLDEAITAHGRILHDATITSINTTPDGGLGVINWHQPAASSLCELVTELAQLLDDDPALIDEQIATALLTGIIAETARFSNHKTTSQTMSTSARLMAAGANQQLVVTKLEEPAPLPTIDSETADGPDGPTDGPAAETPETESGDGVIEISHKDKRRAAGKTRKDGKDNKGGRGKGGGKPPAGDQPADTTAGDATDTIAGDEAGQVTADTAALPDAPLIPDGSLETSETTVLTAAETPDLPVPVEGDDASETAPEPTNKISSLSPGSKMITEPPTLGGLLTANSQRSDPDPSINPLNATDTTDQTLLKRKRRPNSKPASTAAVPTIVDEFAATPASTFDTADTSPKDTGAGANSLADLEDSISNPAAAQAEDLDEARDEVDKALNDASVATPPAPEPLQALGAQPFDVDLHPPAAPATDMAAPASYQPPATSSFAAAPPAFGAPSASDAPLSGGLSTQPPAGFPPAVPLPDPFAPSPPSDPLARDAAAPGPAPAAPPLPATTFQTANPAAPPPVPPPIPFQFGNPNPPQ